MKKLAALVTTLVLVALLTSLTMVGTAAVTPTLTIDFDSASDLTKYFVSPTGDDGNWVVQDGKLINDRAFAHLAGYEADDWYWGGSYLTLKGQQLRNFEIEYTVLFKEALDGDPLYDADFYAFVTNVADGSKPADFTNTGYEWLNFQGSVKGPGVKQFQLWNLAATNNNYNYPWDYVNAVDVTASTLLGVTKKVSSWEQGGAKTFKIVKNGTEFSFYFMGIQQNWGGAYTDYTAPAGGSPTLTNSAMDRAGAVQLKIGHGGYFEIDQIKITSAELDLDAYNTPTPEPTATTAPTSEVTGEATATTAPTSGGSPNTSDVGALAGLVTALAASVVTLVLRRK